jgi:prevent-host-death family protein
MSTRFIDLEHAREQLADLVYEASRGGEVVITSHDEPVARLVAYGTVHPRPRFGSAQGLIVISDAFDEPLEDFKDYLQ